MVGVIATAALLNSAVEATIPYALAAIVVMLPIAFITDLFYRKYETPKKFGAATAILSVHAVIYALTAIGALIITVLTGLEMLINATSFNSGSGVSLVVTITTSLFFGGLFARIIGTTKSKKIAKVYSYIMLILSLGLAITAVAGPLTKSVLTRDDRIIEDNLYSIDQSVKEYIKDNNTLPESLSDITLTSSTDDDVATLIEKNKITYKAGSEETTSTSSSHDSNSTYNRVSTIYTYSLCAQYKASVGTKTEIDNAKENNSKYNTIDTSSHDAGTVCYEQEYTVSTSNSSNLDSDSDSKSSNSSNSYDNKYEY